MAAPLLQIALSVEPSSPSGAMAAGAVGAASACIVALFYRSRKRPPVHALVSIPSILVIGYPLFGLLISGIAFAVCAPTLPYDRESGSLVVLLGVFGPASGITSLVGGTFLEPRAWVLSIWRLGNRRRVHFANLLLAITALALVWGVALARYQLTTPSEQQYFAQRKTEAAQQNRLGAAGQGMALVASRFFQSGLRATDTYQRVAETASLSEKLEACLESSAAVVECGLLEKNGHYSALRDSSVARCGYCNRGSCNGKLEASARHQFSVSLGEHESVRVAMSSAPGWAEPTLLGGQGCEEIAYVVGSSEGHVVSTLSLALLSKEFASLTNKSDHLPELEAYLTDDRGYLLAASIDDRYLRQGSSVGLCMTVVPCGGRAAIARTAAVKSIEEGTSHFSLPAQRYATRLGYGDPRQGAEAHDEPRWLLTLLTLGPDIPR